MTFHLDERFRALLGSHTPERLETEAGTVVGIWPDARIALCNTAWQRFASENDGADVIERWPLGANLLSAISSTLRGYYERAFERVLVWGKVWEQTYYCHPIASQRVFHMRVLPLGKEGLLMIHSLVVELQTPLDTAPHKPLATYLFPDGWVRQCSNCRRTERPGLERAWDWVPEFVATPPPNTTHGICETCFDQFYPGL